MRLIVALFLIASIVSFSYVTVEEDYVKVVFKPSYYQGDVEEVYLFGRFFDYVEMEEENGEWIALLDLGDGVYDYVFLVNGEEEVLDPDAPATGVFDGSVRSAFAVVSGKMGKEIVAPEVLKSRLYENLPFGVGIFRGRVYFKVEDGGYDAVYVAGDFTGWEKDPIPMKKVDGFWIALTDLDEGEHQYKYIFVKSGKKVWKEDPNAPAYVDDGFGGKNGYFVLVREDGRIVVKGEKEKKVEEKTEASGEFSEDFLKALPDGLSVEKGYVFFKVKDIGAERAYLAGTFNNWDPHGIEMRRIGDRWVIWLKLSPGQYQYKYVFVVSGQDVWKEDPNAPGYVPDGFGGKNGIFELAEEDGKLVIEKPKAEGPSGLEIEGKLSFEYRLAVKEEGGISTISGYPKYDFAVSYKPSDSIEVEISFTLGEVLKSALVSFEKNGLSLILRKGLGLDLPLCETLNSVSAGYGALEIGIGFDSTPSYYLSVGWKGAEFYVSKDFITPDLSVAAKVLLEDLEVSGVLSGSMWKFSGEYDGDSISADAFLENGGFGGSVDVLGFGASYASEGEDWDLSVWIPTFVFENLKIFYMHRSRFAVKTYGYGLMYSSDSADVRLYYRVEDMGFLMRYIVLEGNIGF